jgi:uncharacterized repeat protein (TIGR01451 family)
MDICGEFRILTATTDTSNPTGTAVDNASIFIAFNEVTVGPPSKLAFYVQPSTAAVNTAISPAVEVEIQDASGNRVTTATNTVTMSIDTNPPDPDGILSGTLSVAAVDGVATFSNLSIDQLGTGYTLKATSAGLTEVISTTFNIIAGTFGSTVCAGERYGSDLGCTAGDVKITNISIASSTPTSSCTGGETITLDLDVTINFSQAGKYDVGVFMSNDGLDPQGTVANGGSTSCTVSTLPIPPASDQFENLDGGATGDTCGEGSGGLSGILRMNNVTIKCQAVSGSSGNLYIPFVVSWDVNKTPPGKVCTSIADPVPSAQSKCNAPVGSDLAYGVITGTSVLPGITKTDNKTTLSPGETTTYTVVVTNSTGVTITNATFKDVVYTGAPPVACGATCLNFTSATCCSLGGATCPCGAAICGTSTCSVSTTDMQDAGLNISSMPGSTPQAVRGITQANPAVVTYSGADNYANGDRVIISDVVGMTEVNDKEFTVANVNTGANTFQLSGINSSGYTAYTSGGTILKVSSLTFTIQATVGNTPPASYTNTATVQVCADVAKCIASASDSVGGSGSGSGGSRVRVIKWREVFK